MATWATRALAALYALLWAGGVVVGGRSETAPWAGPLFLLVAALLVVLPAPPRLAAGLAAAGLIGYLAEVLGCATGIPFGAYRYTGALGPRLLGVPLVLGCAWIVTSAYALELFRRTGLRSWRPVLAGAAWMVGLDLVIDPLASGPLGYWRWLEGGPYHGVPLLNFAGWFLVSGLILAVLRGVARPAPRSLAVGASVLIFFTVLAVREALLLPALAGLALLGLHLALARRGRI